MPGEEIAPSWLLDDSRTYSQQLHKQKAWLRAEAKLQGGGGSGGGGKDGKKGKGDGKGKKGGKPQAPQSPQT